jgi:hypothetical protein
VVVTHRYVKATDHILQVTRRQFESGVRPVLTPFVTHAMAGMNRGIHAGQFTVSNNGPNEAEIKKVELGFYCSNSTDNQSEPIDYPLFQWRVLNPGQSASQNFRIEPGKLNWHEEHEGECNWIFTLQVTCSDLLRLRTHVYRFDEVLGIHHYILPDFNKPGFLKSKLLTLGNRVRNYRYRLLAWTKAKFKKRKPIKVGVPGRTPPNPPTT